MTVFKRMNFRFCVLEIPFGNKSLNSMSFHQSCRFLYPVRLRQSLSFAFLRSQDLLQCFTNCSQEVSPQCLRPPDALIRFCALLYSSLVWTFLPSSSTKHGNHKRRSVPPGASWAGSSWSSNMCFKYVWFSSRGCVLSHTEHLFWRGFVPEHES